MDTTKIKAAAQTYLDACYESDGDKFREVFHENAHVYGFNEKGELSDRTKDEFIGFVEGRKTPSYKPSFPRQEEILSIEFADDKTAVVRLKVRVMNMMFSDILGFMCLDGKWKIISKLYTGAPIE